MQTIESIYYNEIRGYGPLSPSEEQSLFERMHAGDISARECIIHSHLRLVVTIAKNPKFSRQAEVLDLIQEGNIGLIQAVDSFDPRSDSSFAGFASICIRHSMLNFVQKKYDELLVLDTPVFENDEEYVTQADMLIDEANVLGDASFVNAEEQLLANERRYHLQDALEHLPRREREVLELLYGIGVRDALSVQEVSRLLGVTKERVRQIRNEALNHLELCFFNLYPASSPYRSRTRVLSVKC